MTATAPLLLHVFPTFQVGGSQLRFAAIANHFGSKYRHAILAMDGSYDCLARLDTNLVFEQWNMKIPKRNTIPNVLKFRRILRARRPDLLVTYNWGSLEWALANRPRVVPHLHIEDGFGPEEAEGQFVRRVLARRFALANSVVVLPSLTLRDIALNVWRLPKSCIRHVPNGIQLARFSSTSNPVQVPSGSGPIIGTVAVLRPEKNIARLLLAFRSILEKAPCRLIVAGDGHERVRLEELARQVLPAESVIFTGHVDQVERVYASLDIFALSSDTEQMPTSIIEAMAAGLPVVSTDVGDIARMVSAENSPYIVARNDRLFADALARLVMDDMARRAMGAGNREAAMARYGAERMYSAYDSLFSSLICSDVSSPSRPYSA